MKARFFLYQELNPPDLTHFIIILLFRSHRKGRVDEIHHTMVGYSHPTTLYNPKTKNRKVDIDSVFDSLLLPYLFAIYLKNLIHATRA